MVGPWVVFTVLPAMVPILARAMVAFFNGSEAIEEWINTIDFLVFSIVLLVSNISLNQAKVTNSKESEHIVTGTNIFFLIVVAVGFGYAIDFQIANDDLNYRVFAFSVIVSVATFVSSFFYWRRNVMERRIVQ